MEIVNNAKSRLESLRQWILKWWEGGREGHKRIGMEKEMDF
jgi:hypothetical protein